MVTVTHQNGHKIDTSLFVQNFYLRNNYIEANIEEDIDMKNQFRIKNRNDPLSIRRKASKKYVDKVINDLSLTRNTAHIDLNDTNITNARFIKVSQLQ